jgi:hypothetical protein
MAQTKNKTENFFSKELEQRGFKYDLTEESGYSETRKTDYYRSKNCRFMAIVVNNPIEKEAPNLILSDAKINTLAYDSTLITTDNVIFQGVIASETQLVSLLDLMEIN